MTFRISQTPDPAQWPTGTQLTLAQAAELLELNAEKVATRSRMAAALMGQGFRFEVGNSRK